jgi:RHS repeat-associated protein
VSKTDSAGTTSYKRAGAYVTDSLLKSTVSSTTTDYTPGVSSRVGSDSTFLHSGIKNADTQTDDGGDVSAMRRYDAFGNPVAAWGGWQGPFGYGGPYGYQTDPDHGLMLLGHRYYEADTGRFLTRDPIKDGRNWYGYCGGNPLTSVDIDGLQQVLIIRGAPHRDSPWADELADASYSQHLYGLATERGKSARLLIKPSETEVALAIGASDLEEVWVIGHSAGRHTRLAGKGKDRNGPTDSFFDPGLVSIGRGGHSQKLKRIWILGCNSASDRHTVDKFLDQAHVFEGYDRLVSLWDIHQGSVKSVVSSRTGPKRDVKRTPRKRDLSPCKSER